MPRAKKSTTPTPEDAAVVVPADAEPVEGCCPACGVATLVVHNHVTVCTSCGHVVPAL